MTNARRLTTHDLKERGWTPAMIRDLLGPHDAIRRSELRVGSRSRRVDAEVKLYNEERVLAAESTERFARHQEAARVRQDAAEKAQATKGAGHQRLIDEYLAAPFFGLERHPEAASLSQSDLRTHHGHAWFMHEHELDQMLRPLPRLLKQKAAGQRHTLRLLALYDLYGWEYLGWMKDAKDGEA